jgi:hypothetical protein
MVEKYYLDYFSKLSLQENRVCYNNTVCFFPRADAFAFRELSLPILSVLPLRFGITAPTWSKGPEADQVYGNGSSGCPDNK